jgi:hypothetical protein
MRTQNANHSLRVWLLALKKLQHISRVTRKIFGSHFVVPENLSDRFPLCLKREMCYAFSPITSLPLECVEFSTAKKKILRQEDICLVLEAT